MSTLTSTQLQQQYIAYFGRPGDPAGLKYWLSSSSGISSAREFADKIYAQDEYKNSTVGAKSTEAQVNSLYQNLFGRDADPSGLVYWTTEIEAGNLALSNVAFDLIWAASNPVSTNSAQAVLDAAVLSNKVSAAEAFTADVEASTSALLAYQPEAASPWKSGAAFESAISFVSGITTSAHSDSGVDTAVSSMITANTTAGSTVASTTSKFTNVQDDLVGGAGDDLFNGVLQGKADTGTTIAPGDSASGKDGIDTLNIAVAGDHNLAGAGYTLSAVQTTDVEKILLSNFETETDELTTVAADLMDGVTTIGFSSSSASGDTKITGIKNLVTGEMRNGAADLEFSYTDSILSGTADSQALTLSAVTGGTFTTTGAETIVVNSELASNKITDIADTSLTTLTINGSAALEITTAKSTKTIDASASSGGVTLTLATQDHTVTGGSGDDTIDAAATAGSTDTIKGGAGTDTFVVQIGAATYDGKAKDDANGVSAGELSGVSEFEIINVDSTNDAAKLELDNLAAGITTIQAAANVKTLTVGGQTNNTAITYTLNGTDYTQTATATHTSNAEAAEDLAADINAIDGFTATNSSAVVTITATKGEAIELSAVAGGITGSPAASAYKDVSFDKASADQVLEIYSADLVTHRLKDASGSSDSLTVKLATTSTDKTFGKTFGDLNIGNIETLNLDSSGLVDKSDDSVINTLSALSGDSALTTLNITGDSNLVITNHRADNSKLATIDASTFTANLTLSDAVATLAQTITTGVGNDTVAFGANLTGTDVVDLGGNTIKSSTGKMGKDTVTASGNLGSSAVSDVVLQISNVETFELTHDTTAFGAYIDTSKMSVDTMAFTNDTAGGTVKLINLPASQTIGIGVGTGELGATSAVTLDLALADATGSADSITLDYSDTLNASATQVLKTTGIETVNIKGSKTSSTITNTITSTDFTPSKIVLTDGSGTSLIDFGTLNKATTSIDGSGFLGGYSATAASDIQVDMSADGSLPNVGTLTVSAHTDGETVTYSINGVAQTTGTIAYTTDAELATDLATDITLIDGYAATASGAVVTVTAADGLTLNFTSFAAGTAVTVGAISYSSRNSLVGSSKADTFTLAGKIGQTVHTVTGNGGTDVLNATISAADTDFSAVGVETLNLTVADEATAGFDNTTEDAGLNTATTINILGGNSLSSFTVGTDATIDDGTDDQVIDASTFNGKLDLTLAANAFDSSLTIKGGDYAKDKVTFSQSGTDNKIESMTGVEILAVNSVHQDTSSKSDLSNVSGLTTVEASFITGGGTEDHMEIAKYPTGALLKLSYTEAEDNLVLGMTDASADDTTLTIEMTAAVANDDIDLDIAGLEFLTIDTKDTVGGDYDLDGVSGTGTNLVSLTLKGNAAELETLNEDITTVNGASMIGGLTLLAANRPAVAMTITGGIGDDILSMEHKNDVIDAGLGTDTLNISGIGILGGFAVDLTSTTDQVSTFAGITNGSIQKGFTHVDASGVTGSFGIDVEGTKVANTITGTNYNDNLSGGKGDDTIVDLGGFDYITGGAGADTFEFRGNAAGETAPNEARFDTLADYVAGTDIISGQALAGTAVTLVTATNAATATVANASVASGVVAFNVADDTLAERIVAVAGAISDTNEDGTGGDTAAGEVLRFGVGSDSYIFISDAVDGVSPGDNIIKIPGVTTSTSNDVATITDGNITTWA